MQPHHLIASIFIRGVLFATSLPSSSIIAASSNCHRTTPHLNRAPLLPPLPQVVPVRPFKHDEYERFLLAAYPYYTSAVSTMVAFFALGLVFLYGK